MLARVIHVLSTVASRIICLPLLSFVQLSIWALHLGLNRIMTPLLCFVPWLLIIPIPPPTCRWWFCCYRFLVRNSNARFVDEAIWKLFCAWVTGLVPWHLRILCETHQPLMSYSCSDLWWVTVIWSCFDLDFVVEKHFAGLNVNQMRLVVQSM